MKSADDEFREMLTGCPFDDSFREEHRREVRERAMRAFDAAGDAPLPTISFGHAAPRRLMRSRPARWLVAAAAASVVAVVGWYVHAGRAVSPVDSSQLAGTRSAAAERADRELAAALELLSAFDNEQAAATFDQGVQVCLSERHGRGE